MPDTRQHRGPHPEDAVLFADAAVPRLREAVHDLSWLLTRGYAEPSATKVVGDRYGLTERQRLAVRRSSCSLEALARRMMHQVKQEQLSGQPVIIDGFNLVTTIEAALSGGVILVGRDGCYRDMASMHGNYRKVAETRPALELVGQTLAAAGIARAQWLLDSPVSNSGRLSVLIREVAQAGGWQWTVDVIANPDRDLIQSKEIAVTADSGIIDQCERWFPLARLVVGQRVPQAWLIRLDIDSPLANVRDLG